MSDYLLRITASKLRAEHGGPRTDGSLGQLLAAKTAQRGVKQPQPNEVEAWNQSLPALAKELEEADLGDVTMFIEFAMPPSDDRADVVLAGPRRDDGEPAYTVVELKQWTEFPVCEADGSVWAGSRRGRRTWTKHPWKQVRNYIEYLSDAYGLLGADPLYGAVFLHNATDAFMQQLRQVRAGAGSDMFGDNERAAFQNFLRRIYRPGSSFDADRQLRFAQPRQSENLLNRIHAEFDRTAKDRFVLLGEQVDAYNEVFEAVRRAARTRQKAAVIVRGKPGTGKTAVGLKLAGDYFRGGQGVYYQVWHQAFREALIEHSGLRRTDAEQVFVSPRGKEVREHSAPDNIALSICDEAHRLEERTSTRSVQGDGPQIDDILAVTNVHVFFVDDDQQVKMKEVGTTKLLRKELEDRHVLVSEVELTTQFRSGGVAAYVDWVRNLVGLDPSSPGLWQQREDFELWIAEWPGEVERILQAKATDNTHYRMTAGFCWQWPETGRGKVEIGKWRKDWNLRKAADDGPESVSWAWGDDGHLQVGCVHTAQGLEWEWTGIIIGRDLIWRDGLAKPVLEENVDLPNYARDSDKRAKARKLLRNAYYILMTRGQRGAVIYAEDNLLRAELRSLVEPLPLPKAAEPEDKWERQRKKLHQQTIDVVYEAQEAGARLPHVGLEYVPGHRSKYAWREELIAVLPDDLDPADALRAEQAYAEAGWVARRESDWDPESLRSALLNRLERNSPAP